MSDIQLTIKNQSKPDNAPTIVLYQNNVRGSFQNCLAWKVIKNLGYMDLHPMLYQDLTQVSVMSNTGKKSMAVPVHNGQRLDVVEVNGRLELAVSNTPPTDSQLFQIANMTSEVLEIHITRTGSLVAAVKNVQAKRVVDFQFSASIRIGAVDGAVVAGTPLPLNMMTEFLNTEIPLQGIAKAEVVMTFLNNANVPFYQFSLQNIVLQ